MTELVHKLITRFITTGDKEDKVDTLRGQVTAAT
jgi:hypothetical protein